MARPGRQPLLPADVLSGYLKTIRVIAARKFFTGLIRASLKEQTPASARIMAILRRPGGCRLHYR